MDATDTVMLMCSEERVNIVYAVALNGRANATTPSGVFAWYNTYEKSTLALLGVLFSFPIAVRG